MDTVTNNIRTIVNGSCNIAFININTISSATKLEALKTFIRTMDLDVIFLQEVYHTECDKQRDFQENILSDMRKRLLR